MDNIKSGNFILVVWTSKINIEILKEFTEEIKKLVGSSGHVALENIDMLISSKHTQSSFQHAFINSLQNFDEDLPLNIAAEILRLLKPCGKLVIKVDKPSAISSTLKLAGFAGINESLGNIRASKPDFEVGSNVKLSFGTGSASKTWKIEAEDDGIELNDPDDLLTEEDLVIPDPASLKVCGTTGKRKACKNCVCGLAEELDEEVAKEKKAPSEFKPACGNCYLGDAFRCASCPHLGMPAFKPGEKVKLSSNTLVDEV